MITLVANENSTQQCTAAMTRARRAQAAWAGRSIETRVELVQRLRQLIAARAVDLAQAAAAIHRRPVDEKLAAEVLPLLEACRFLRKAPAILRTQHYRRFRPAWLGATSFQVQRKPLGLILIVGPRNYPLFIPGVQSLHALAAGNGVLIKPAPGARDPMALLRELAITAGFPPDLIVLLSEDVSAAREAVDLGVDKAVFTGSSIHGRDFLRHLAKYNTPAVMELAGADNVFVRADADLDFVVTAITFALRLNGGNSCIAPKTLYVHESVAGELRARLRSVGLTPPVTAFRDDPEALALVAGDEFGLGASVFSRNEKAARRFAAKLLTGSVTINDIIVPTADPRLPFGGIRASGFGCTRGAEGLVEMTFPHVITVSRGRSRRHLQQSETDQTITLQAVTELLHCSDWRARWGAGMRLVSFLRRSKKAKHR